MNVAILHYHFDRGGVTRVVSSTLDAFRGDSSIRFGLLSGRPVEGMGAPVELIPELDYSSPDGISPDPAKLLSKVVAAARKLFGGQDPDVWHIHNPALGKNTAFCGLVHRLATEGHALLLQEHDFAEDFRPANFRLREQGREPTAAPFPHAPRVRFATINGRDKEILQAAGIPAERVFPLPNPVPPTEEFFPPSDSNILLYPVRALARKNLGELLLLAYAAGDRYRWETTLPPTNPAYRAQFARWKEVAASLDLPVRLGVADEEDIPFSERMASCRAVVTTSVAEGFGLSFLEPWTYGRPVIGRDLPEITGEFRNEGIPLASLYNEFPIPAAAVDRLAVAKQWRSGIEFAYEAFGVPAPEADLNPIECRLREAEQIDFALLGEKLQESTLINLRREEIPIYSPLPEINSLATETEAISNKILSRFSIESYAAKLRGIYETLAQSPEESLASANPVDVLRGFLRPERFRPHFVS